MFQTTTVMRSASFGTACTNAARISDALAKHPDVFVALQAPEMFGSLM